MGMFVIFGILAVIVIFVVICMARMNKIK